VADERGTVVCRRSPLRDVMRQISRTLGYTWTRQADSGGYRYELAQDLRSQLLEEQLRNQDRDAALLDLERQIERYRPYVGLSPDQARARIQHSSSAERPLLEKLSGWGWAPIQMYFRLRPQELAALRAGRTLTFSAEAGPGEK